MRRALLALVLVVGLALAGASVPAGAQDDDPSVPQPVPEQDIIPRPNSGHAPEEAGDRGGALQLLLLGLLVVAVAGGGWHLVRQARRPSEP